MRLAISLGLLCIMTAASVVPCGAAAQLRDKWALLVGVDACSANNVSDLTTVLQNPNAGRFAADHVMALTGDKATKSGVDSAINDWLLKKALPDDLVFIYLSSASAKGPHGEPMVLTYDGFGPKAAEAGIDVKALAENLKRRIQSPNIVMAIDASPLGGTAPDFSKLSDTGVTLLTATTGAQTSITNGALNRSLFEHHLGEAIKHGGGTMTVRQIYDYVAGTVNADAQGAFKTTQNPVLVTPSSGVGALDLALGTTVRNIGHRNYVVGHPIDQLALSRPDLMTATAQPGQAGQHAQRATKAAAADDDDDDDEPRHDVDYGPYIDKMKADIRKAWKPPKGLESQHVVAVFTILRDGRIVHPSVVESSGNQDVDKSALDALAAASPLDPLPNGAPRSVDMKYKFDWNVH